jgi:hypothetical protein
MALPERAEPPHLPGEAGPEHEESGQEYTDVADVANIGQARAGAERGGRLRRSMAELEHAFSKEISLERHRRDSLKRTAERRTLKREVQRRHKRGSMRFALLVLTLVMTAVIVTVVMFRVLYLLLS